MYNRVGITPSSPEDNLIIAQLYSYYIKYDTLLKLNEIVEPNGKGYVNIYIDLYNIIKNVSEYVCKNKTYVITSTIINLAGHYRFYYKTRHRLWARIYLVYADGSNENHRVFMPSFGRDNESYGSEWRAINKNQNITNELEMVKILCGYINDIYYVRKFAEFPEAVYDIITHNPQDDINIVITRSKYAYQLPTILNNTYLFRPKKTKEGDYSFIVAKNNALLCYYNKAKSSGVMERLSYLDSGLLSVLMSINGCREKKISSVANITKASSIVYNAVIENRIINGHNINTESLYNSLYGINRLMDASSFEYRFKALDLIYQHIIYDTSVESKDYSWNVNLKDPQTIHNINNTYFVANPLILDNF